MVRGSRVAIRLLFFVLLVGGAIAAPTGPLPDSGPYAGVATHDILGSVGGPLLDALDEGLGERHVVEHHLPPVADDDAGTLMWLRDFQPIYVRGSDGSLVALRYLTEDRARTSYPLDLRGPPGLPMLTLPLLHENGNLVSTGEFVVTTRTLFEQNRRPATPALTAAGYRPRTPAQVLDVLASALRVDLYRIIVLPPMPEEPTGHADMYVLAIDERTVVVPEIRPEAVSAAQRGRWRLAARVHRFLDAQAHTLEERGLQVLRLPMIAPVTLPAIDRPASDETDTLFYSPSNALLVRTGGHALAFVPTFDEPGFTPMQRALQKRYEAEWIRLLKKRGWEARPVDATDLIRYMGVFRCVSAPIPG